MARLPPPSAEFKAKYPDYVPSDKIAMLALCERKRRAEEDDGPPPLTDGPGLHNTALSAPDLMRSVVSSARRGEMVLCKGCGASGYMPCSPVFAYDLVHAGRNRLLRLGIEAAIRTYCGEPHWLDVAPLIDAERDEDALPAAALLMSVLCCRAALRLLQRFGGRAPKTLRDLDQSFNMFRSAFDASDGDDGTAAVFTRCIAVWRRDLRPVVVVARRDCMLDYHPDGPPKWLASWAPM